MMAPSKVFSLSSLRSSREKAKSTPASLSSPFAPTGSFSESSASPKTPARSHSDVQPPLVGVAHETPPELQPTLTFLSNHSKKLYTEGYFLKLTDLNPDGKPHTDRQWIECFAQLVGAVLSLWEAAALDAAGENEEIVPTFLNLTDASIRMIDTLPTKTPDAPTLKNVLSISTAGKNRYLFFFNSHHSLTQWTAGIRLSLFELAMLQEAYTGALIGGKGKSINGINNITQRTRFKYEDWARVRFAAGEPWNKYWAVVSPPDEKLYQKWKKEVKKGKEPREPLALGNIKFYVTKKTKKATPVATIANAYSCYAIYPQSEALIEHSTLVKIEGQVTAQGATEPREGFVFVMPASHPGVSGFEMMFRWLFPSFDAFHLYGRPQGLAAEVTDIRSLMFAMPRDAKYGYLEVADVAHLISSQKRKIVSEVEWRQKLKELTLEKMQTVRNPGNSIPIHTNASALVFDDYRSSASSSPVVPYSPYPPQDVPMTPPIPSMGKHNRSMSEAQGSLNNPNRSMLGSNYERPSTAFSHQRNGSYFHNSPHDAGSEAPSDDDGNNLFSNITTRSAHRPPQLDLPEDVPSTPTMAHTPTSRPSHPLPPTPGHHSRMSVSTLETLGQGATVGGAYQRYRNHGKSFESVETYDSPPRHSHESNMFEDLPVSRPQWASNAAVGSSSSNRPHHPLPPTPLRGFETRQEERSYSPPAPDPPRHIHLYAASDSRSNSTRSISPPKVDNQRSMWERGGEKPRDPTEYRPSPLDVRQVQSIMNPLPSPPIPAKIPLKTNSVPQLPALQTDIQSRNNSMLHTSSNNTSASIESMGSLANHVVSTEALNRVSHITRIDSSTDMSQVRERPRMTRAHSESGSEYDNNDTDDYASTDAGSEDVKYPPRAEGTRAGVMKTVGQKKGDDILIGDSHYMPVAPSLQERDVSTDIPKVDFGRTFNHGKSLSNVATVSHTNAHARTVSRGNGQISNHIHHIHSEQASPVEIIKGTTQHNLDSVLSSGGHNRNVSAGSSNAFGEAKRPHHMRQYSSPEPTSPGDGKGPNNAKSQSSSRNMAWQPGLVQQPGGNTKFTNRSEAPERYVTEQAAVARQQSQARNRYVHSRRPSRNSSTEQIPRPPSRGGNVPFTPHGLISGPDLSSHLSAREQEYIARKTGTTLLQIDSGNTRKQPVHQAGLLGAIEAREKEKKEMWDGRNAGQGIGNNITVQQALAQRQFHTRAVSTSSRGPTDASGRIANQQVQQNQQSHQLATQPDFYPQQSQVGYGSQNYSQHFGYTNQGGHGHYNGR